MVCFYWIFYKYIFEVFYLDEQWRGGESARDMEEANDNQRARYCFTNRAGFFRHVHCSSYLEFGYLFPQRFFQNYPQVCSQERRKSVRTTLWFLATLSIFQCYSYNLFNIFLQCSILYPKPCINDRRNMGGGRWEAKLDMAALRLGLVGNIGLTFLFFPVTRGSSVLPLLGLTSEGSIKYHIWLGHIVMAFFTAHGLSYIIYWAATHQLSQVINSFFFNILRYIYSAVWYVCMWSMQSADAIMRWELH